MNFIAHHKQYNIQCPLARTEGKLKAHESCLDVRAWSHDLRQRDRYLREWIKCDMPTCLVPITTLIGFFSAMTCMSKGRATPRCHPNCKSKVILESITKSCEAIRECLKADRNLDKFVCEEEFETSHWPCEKCLEALKYIKMFWKVLLEKVFAINLTKTEPLEDEICNCNSVRDVARHWERDMVQQATFVKAMTPQPCGNAILDDCSKKSCLKKSASMRCIPPSCCGDKLISYKITPSKCSHKKVTLNCMHFENDDNSKNPFQSPKKSCKCVSVKVNTSEACCGCDFINQNCDCNLETYKNTISSLQRKNCAQREEIERLKQENRTLRCELQNAKKGTCEWKSPIYCAATLLPIKDKAALIPKPYESYLEDNCSSKSSTKEADSEVLITMKKCKHESYKHVSLLQVLHKTNDPCIQEQYINEPCYKNEDPIQLLTKVQATLGAMVKREMSLAKTKTLCGNDSEIEASFQRINGLKGGPYCKISESDLDLSYSV